MPTISGSVSPTSCLRRTRLAASLRARARASLNAPSFRNKFVFSLDCYPTGMICISTVFWTGATVSRASRHCQSQHASCVKPLTLCPGRTPCYVRRGYAFRRMVRARCRRRCTVRHAAFCKTFIAARGPASLVRHVAVKHQPAARCPQCEGGHAHLPLQNVRPLDEVAHFRSNFRSNLDPRNFRRLSCPNPPSSAAALL